jgi:uncharacterized membrane protein
MKTLSVSLVLLFSSATPIVAATLLLPMKMSDNHLTQELPYPNQLLQHQKTSLAHQRNTLSTPQGTTPTLQYITIDLAEATDPLGVAQCEAVGINNNGEVVGYEVINFSKYRSIYWDQNGSATILENYQDDNSSRPYMIDDTGLILGWSALVTYEQHGDWTEVHMNQTAVTWKDGVISNLNDDITGGDVLDLYHAMDKNDAGTIIGSGALPGNEPPPWWPNGYIFDDGLVTDLGTFTYPEAINHQGNIAGYIEGGFTHAYKWENGVQINLNNHSSIHANYSKAFDINDNDVIVGFAQMDYTTQEEPIIWIDQVPISPFPDSPNIIGTSTAINEHDEVVGWYADLDSPTPAWLAFLWKDGQTITLNDLLPSGQGWDDIYPADINDNGQIVGLGYRAGFGWRAFLMTPLKPVLDLEVQGGFGITASLHNTGDTSATNISWTITVDNGFLLLGKKTTGSIPTLSVGDTSQIKSKLIVGLGKSLITVQAVCDEGVEVKKSVNGTVFVFFILALK